MASKITLIRARVTREKIALDKKIRKLSDALNGMESNIPQKFLPLLRIQLNAMLIYTQILGERLAQLKAK